ncbi:MAG TPA: hypothetical protein VLV54_07445 [Thermoanaerobaculia bacterium]|nr:hypothetical protein [Thermoanaerobaculia bacterium]
MNRRELIKSVLGSLASYSLLETLFTRDAFCSPVKPVTDRWVRDLNDMSRDLKTGRIAPAVWQAKVKDLYDRIELPELLAAIDFDRLSARFDYPDLGVSTRPVEFPRLDGIPRDIVFVRKIFGMKKDRAIIPHGHKNMTSCHYVLKGEFQLKQYDKVEEDTTHMVIEPTIHEIARVGSHSSISDEKDNIHWLRATTATAFTFDAIVLDLKGRKADVENIDPDGGERISGGRLRVRKLSVEEALHKYGHDTHH